MNDHFVQRHDEQGALVKAAPDSNRMAFAIDTVRRNGPICTSPDADARSLHLPVRTLRPDAGSVPQPTAHTEAGPFILGVTTSGAWSQSGAGDAVGNSLTSSNGTLSAPEDENASTSEDSVTSALPGGQRRILIVDDNVDAAESLGELLKVCGHDIHIAHDGASAISEALRLRPEAVILDIGLPAMNGYEVAQRLRLDVGLNTSLLVALTGYAEESDRISAEKAGFDHYFAKPLDINKLVTVLDNLK